MGEEADRKRRQVIEAAAAAEEGEVSRREGTCLWHAMWPEEKVGNRKCQPDGCGPGWRVVSPPRLCYWRFWRCRWRFSARCLYFSSW